MILDAVFRYLSLFLLYINIKIGKTVCLMLDYPVATCLGKTDVHLAVAGVMSLKASFSVVVFPTRCLG